MIIIMITIIKYTDALLNNRYFHRIPLNIFNKNGTRGVQFPRTLVWGKPRWILNNTEINYRVSKERSCPRESSSSKNILLFILFKFIIRHSFFPLKYIYKKKYEYPNL